MKKRLIALALSLTMAFSLTACGGGGDSSSGTGGSSSGGGNSGGSSSGGQTVSWTPSKSVSIVCLSASGGGSDINTRAVIDVMNKIGVDASFVVDYQNDGGGAVGWVNVAETTNDDHLLMCYGFGDVINQVGSNTGYGVDDYKAIAVVSAEQVLLLTTPDCKYASFEEAVEAAKSGTTVTIAGSGGVDPLAYSQMLEACGVTEDQMPYVQHNSTGEAVVTMLGNHCDYVICKPSSCISYVESGDLVPVVAFYSQRLDAPLDTAPTMEELGYTNVEAPMWRGFVAPTSISDEAYAYYCDIFTQLIESEEWMTEYVEKYAASPVFLIGEEAQTYMKESEDEYIASLG